MAIGVGSCKLGQQVQSIEVCILDEYSRVKFGILQMTMRHQGITLHKAGEKEEDFKNKK